MKYYYIIAIAAIAMSTYSTIEAMRITGPDSNVGSNSSINATGGDLYCNYGECSASGDCEGNYCACFNFRLP